MKRLGIILLHIEKKSVSKKNFLFLFKDSNWQHNSDAISKFLESIDVGGGV